MTDNPYTPPEPAPAPPPPAPQKKSPAQLAAEVIGALLGAGVTITLLDRVPSNLWPYIISGALVGTVMGLLPFFVARNRGRKQYGGWSLIACFVAGGALGLLLALPLAVVLAIIAARLPRTLPSQE